MLYAARSAEYNDAGNLPALSLSGSILEYVNALKWPGVVGGSIYYFREPLKGILERVQSAKKAEIKGPAGTGISWDDTLDRVDASVKRASLTRKAERHLSDQGQPKGATEVEEASEPAPASEREEERDLRASLAPDWAKLEWEAQSQPELAVLDAYREVELKVGQLALLPAPRRHGELASAAFVATSQLAQLRNGVVHERARPNAAGAVKYVNSARRAWELIDTAVSDFLQSGA